MAEAYGRQSPLAHLQLSVRAEERVGSAGIKMTEIPFLEKIVVRGSSDDTAFLTAVEEVVGAVLPIEPNTVNNSSGIEDLRVIWLGPDEWLVVAREGVIVKDRLENSIKNLHHTAITDVSESRTVIQVSGCQAYDVVSKGCAIDLHPRAFGPGRCAQTMFAKAHVILHQTNVAPVFDIYVHRSFAEYLWFWLEDASAEYGLKVGK